MEAVIKSEFLRSNVKQDEEVKKKQQGLRNENGRLAFVTGLVHELTQLESP